MPLSPLPKDPNKGGIPSKGSDAILFGTEIALRVSHFIFAFSKTEAHFGTTFTHSFERLFFCQVVIHVALNRVK